jgi:tetratricopeptide (TPR) repeat protein
MMQGVGVRKYNLDPGLRLLKQRQYEDVFESFKMIVNRQPDAVVDILTVLYKETLEDFFNINLRYLIAQIYFYAKDYEEARRVIEESLQMEPDFSEGFFLLAKIYHRNSQKEKIKEIFEQAIANCIFDSTVLDVLPKIYVDEKQIDKNIELYNKLLIYFPQKITYYKVLAELYPKKHRYEQAAQMYKKITELSTGYVKDALDGCERLCRLAPEKIVIREILIDLCFRYFKPVLGVKYMKEILELDSTKTEEVIKKYKEALSLYPDSYDILLALADAMARQDRYTEAVDSLRKVFEQNKDETDEIIHILDYVLGKFPNQIMALMLLADIYMQRRDYEKALKYLTVLAKLNSEELDVLIEKVEQCARECPQAQTLSQYVLCQIYFERKELEKCFEEAEKLLDTDFDIKGRLLQVNVLAEFGQYGKAMESLFKALDLFKNDWEIHAVIKLMQDRIISAEIEKRLKSKQEKIKEQEKNLFELGLLYLRQGDVRKAIESFQRIVESPDLKLRADILIGRCFLELGRFDLSITKLIAVLDQIRDTDVALANKVRYFLSINFINSGNISSALAQLEDIMTTDINFPNINEIISKFKQESFLDLSGRVGLGCFSWGEQEGLSILVVRNKEEEKRLRKKKNWQNVSFAHPHNNQGVDYMLQQNLKAAEDEFLLATQLDPAFVISYCNLAFLNILNEKYAQVEGYLEKAQNLNPKLDLIYFIRGILKAKQNDEDAALENLLKAVSLNKENYLALVSLGDIYYRRKNVAEAFLYWKKAAGSENLFYLLQRRVNYLRRESFNFLHWISDFCLVL